MNRRKALQALGVAAGTPLLSSPFETLLEVGRAARGAGQADGLQALSAEQASLAMELAEIILPRTGTPGATDADVVGFIDTLMAGWMSAEESASVAQGLAWVDQRAAQQHGRGFVACSAEQRLELVEQFDREVAELLAADEAAPADEYLEDPDGQPAPQAPGHFFYQMKRLTMLGYFTSQPGMVETLRFNPFPGRWDPCMVLEQGS